MIPFNVTFWQRIVSPHMGALAAALARRGHSVTYVAEETMSADRSAMGWAAPDLSPARVVFAPSGHEMVGLLETFPVGTIHLCQGLRSNGSVRQVQRVMAARGLAHWVLMETIEDTGLTGTAKRLVYSRLLRRFQKTGAGILAIGDRMPSWLAGLGVDITRVAPFAYFLAEQQTSRPASEDPDRLYRFAFVGQLIARKRVQDILAALARLPAEPMFEFWIVGDGEEAPMLRILADRLLPGRVRWLGTLPLTDVPSVLSQVDLLVLPSRHDGWGAVVSEALMLGTPAISSDRCGSAVAVRASGVGGVFPMGNIEVLSQLLETALTRGPVTSSERCVLAEWAKCLGAVQGADYLERILLAHAQNKPLPHAPWVVLPPFHRKFRRL